MSKVQYGLPLSQQSTQTILPVIIDTNMVVGFYTIAKTTFSNPMPATYKLAEGNVAVSTVTLPVGVTNSNGPTSVPQYVAALVPFADSYKKPWLGFTAFMDPKDLGEFHRWALPSMGAGLYQDNGSLINALKVSLNIAVAQPVKPNAPNPKAGSLSWQASASVNSFNMEMGFVDFNWVTLFKESNTGANPLRITTISNPVGGQLKSTIVNSQTYVGDNAVIFDTVRIILLRPVAAGAYQFVFAVTDQYNQSTNVNFTLNIS
jgi:hypothetical protein